MCFFKFVLLSLRPGSPLSDSTVPSSLGPVPIRADKPDRFLPLLFSVEPRALQHLQILIPFPSCTIFEVDTIDHRRFRDLCRLERIAITTVAVGPKNVLDRTLLLKRIFSLVLFPEIFSSNVRVFP